MRLIKIGASWCGPCNLMDKRLKDFNACEYKAYDVGDEDDETAEIVEKYNVRSIPVIVLEGDNGEELAKWVGAVSLEDIMEKININKLNVN